MRKLLRFVVVVVLLLAGALYALTFVDLGRFAPQIEAAAKDATGRTLKIEGGIHIGYSLVPTVVAEKISFGNADWGTRPQMLTADSLSLQLALLPLLSGNVDLREVALSGADIYLETDRRGRGNWEFGEAAPAAPSGGGGLALAGIPQIEIADLRIAYRDGTTGETTAAAFREITARPKGDGFHAVVEGDVNGAAVAFAADIAGDATKIVLSDAALSVAGTSVGGDLALDLTGRPRLTGALSSPKFDVTPFLGGGASGGTSSKKGGGPVFSRDPLPLEALDAFDAELAFTLGELHYGKLVLADMKLPLTIRGGRLDAPLTAAYRGTPMKLTLNADGKAKSVAVDAAATNFDIGRLLTDLDLTTMLAARADFGAKLTGRGASLHAIAASLGGQTNLAIGEGTINSRAFAVVSDDLVNVLIPGGKTGDTARLVCVLSAFDFSGGVGTARALALETDSLITTGSGTVDLGRERIDLLFKPKPKKASLVSLAFPVRLSGPLSAPTAGLDRAGVATGVATAVGGAALTGGIGALLPLMSTGSGSVAGSGDCGAAAAAAQEESRGITGTVKDVGGAIGGAAEDAAKGIGGAVRGIFGR